jgi:transcriptional regulator with XRE-family HTH domain
MESRDAALSQSHAENDSVASELKRRIEAARAYAGIKNQHELGEAIGFRRPTFVRYLNGKGPFRPGDLKEIARVCGVPFWFLRDGWSGASGPIAKGEGEEPEDVVGAMEEESKRDARKAVPNGNQQAGG